MELNPGDLITVLEKIHTASTKWCNIGLQLRVPKNTLDSLKVQFTDPRECLRELLNEWLKQIDPTPTWKALIDALNSPTVGEGQLAEGLRTQYCQLSKGIVVS